MVHDMLAGAIALGSLAVGLFFFRYWYTSRDRFFLYFALSFWIEGLSRIHMGLNSDIPEDVPVYYMIRILSYGLILLAIWEKNRPEARPWCVLPQADRTGRRDGRARARLSYITLGLKSDCTGTTPLPRLAAVVAFNGSPWQKMTSTADCGRARRGLAGCAHEQVSRIGRRGVAIGPEGVRH